MPLRGGEGGAIGRYTLVDRLGAGGMGVVYLGRSASGRRVAVKVVHAQFAEDPEFRVRFRQEVAAARRVSGAFTAPVVDADPDAEQPWMATLYIPGPNLAERVAGQGPLSGGELRGLALGLVEAVRDIHQAGLVHRDLKPANVLMSEDGPRVIDFGISRAADGQTMTATGRAFGTPPFMSPEQLNAGRDIGPASDIFSLAALLVHAATARGPFDADSPYMTAYQVVHQPPVLDGVPEPLRTILAQCLDKSPGNRPGLDELLTRFAELPEDGTEAGWAGAVASPTARIPAVASPATVDTDAVPAPAVAGGAEGGRARRRRPAERRPGRRGLLLSVGTVLVLAGLGATAAAWSGWGEQDTGGKVKGADGPDPQLPDGWGPWQTTVGQKSEATGNTAFRGGCAVDGEALYCGGEGLLASRLNSSTGKAAWRVPSTSDSAVPLLVRKGTVVVNDFVGPDWSTEERQWVTGLATGDGKVRWTHSVAMDSQPVAVGELIVTVSVDERNLLAMNASDGEEAWRWALPPDQYCGPWVADDAVLAFCRRNASDSDKGTLWRIDPADGTARELGPVPVGARPAGMDGETLVLVEHEGGATGTAGPYTGVRRVNTENGRSEGVSLPDAASGAREDLVRVVDGTLYVVRANGTVTALSARTGEQRWRRGTEMEGPSVPVLSEKYGALYFVDRHGRLLALRADDGKKLWQAPARDGAGDRSALGGPPSPVVLVDDALTGLVGRVAFSVDPSDPAAQP
ncbi:PQQ-binding-like beta-propeller repeat protein [Streptomyces sp. NPDC058653]|uniref:serine/threonine-protein kinase n=1 Tax=Streptomyces sp. NPDC058653 TaxID=3346576 RepID=UPI0036488B26